MWLENEKFKEIDQAVSRGERQNLLRILAEFFHPDNQTKQKPSTCPRCQKPLQRKMLSYLEYFVHACPDRHGAWMSPEVSEKVRNLVHEQVIAEAQKRSSFQWMMTGIVFLIGILIWGYLPYLNRSAQTPVKTSSMEPAEFFLPLSQEEILNNFENPEHAAYLQQVLSLLEFGAVNRMEIEQSLKGSHPFEEKTKQFEIYRKKHDQLLSKLQVIPVPEAFAPLHERLLQAAKAQIAFYAIWLEEQSKRGSVDLQTMLTHSALQKCHEALLQAYAFLLSSYPNLDPSLQESIRSRFSWFDII